MTIKLNCNKSNPPLGAVLAANLINSTKNGSIKVEWGQKNSLENSSPEVLCETAQELLRTVARVCKDANLYGSTPLERTQIDHWLCYTVGPLAAKNEFSSALSNINKILGPITYICGSKISAADLAIFACLFGNKQWQALVSKKAAPSNVLRWYKFIESQDYVKKGIEELSPAILEALKKASEDASNEGEPQLTAGGRAREGKFVELPGAEMGKVVVRFPPEASGYLHIGHAKAALLNQYYQQAFDGKLIMRFDDTNPAKENTHFEEVILEDVAMLEIKPDRFTYTSDYFDLFLEYCEKMLKDGNAYVDDTEPEAMKNEREQKVESANRSNSVEKNFKMWEDMRKGTEYGQKCCVRAKIDMKSLNGCMRDPTIYRCKNEAHPRTGTKYRVYPTYDFACPIVDSIEGVTHTLRTMEYHDRDPQFYWFIDVLGLRKPYIWEYSRLSMTNTVLSKRKLTWFVEQGLVDGWDDPRMPTVRGVLRRGMTVEGLKEFIIAQGSSRSVVFMEWDKIWAFNKKVIDPIAPRYTVVDFETNVLVTVKGAKEECLTVPKHPKNAEIGTKSVWVGPKLLIDQADAENLKEGENATFIHWGNLLIKKINRRDGKVQSVEAEPNLDNKDYKKTTKVTFLCDTPKAKATHTFCVYFDHIISKPLLGKDEDFKQFIGHETRRDLQVLGDPELKNLKQGDIIQIQRRGFFRVDVPFGERSLFTCKEQPIILFYIPDGSSKDNSFAAVGSKQDKTVKKEEKSSSKVGNVEVKTPKTFNTNSAESINESIIKQGDEVRDLKAKKASKTDIDAAVKVLLSLKADYKQVTGVEWKPGCVPPKAVEATTSVNKASSKSAESINEEIAKQGNEVRDLKGKKASKADIDAAVKVLLSLKADYKQVTGTEWKPGCVPPKAAEATTPLNSGSSKSAESINEEIIKQGNEVRDLKAKKASKADIDAAVKALLSLKADYKQVSGAEWKPGCVPPKALETTTPANKSSSKSAESINEEITKQGNEVRDLKAKKASKADIDAAVKVLLSLKADYKQVSGAEWKPGCAPPKAAEATTPSKKPSSKSAESINEEITKQGDQVRDLKAKKASKADIDAAVKVLLSLKADYKQLSGAEWKPGCVPPKAAEATTPLKKPSSKSAESINEEITKQGDQVRDLKAKKASKADIDAAVKVLLSLKADYKQVSGAEWKPGCVATSKPAEFQNEKSKQNVEEDLKAMNAAKEEIGKILLSLKAEYKRLVGTVWKPETKMEQLVEKLIEHQEIVQKLENRLADKRENKILPEVKEEFKDISGKDPKTETSVCSSGDSNNAVNLTSAINEQGGKVRDLKAKKASKEEIDKEVKVLLDLKAEYKKQTGTDFPAGGKPSNDKPAKQPKEKKENKPKQQQKQKEQSPTNDDKGVKKQTRLGLEAKKEDDLPTWYSQVITKSEMLDYYDVSGCYIYRPWSYDIWEVIQDWFKKEIKKLGVKHCYFPIFVSKAMLEKEKKHIADFSPEVAWVTKAGDSEMSEPVAIRPTSETVMYPAYAKWIQSYRDLPIKLNQWNNVVRWEFKHPQPFLRTREFLWQEGHTAFATQEEAQIEVTHVLDLYAKVYTDLLAVPVIKGRKTEKEKFAGGVYTYTVEAYIPTSGRAIQGATSHHLGQNFSKMFDITYEDPETQEKKYVYQNSWGITTRTIGVMIMVHSDNQGLVLPPNVASVQTVIVPCGITVNLSKEGRDNLQSACSSLENELRSADVRVEGDYRDYYSPGWKFNHWELKGVPIRIELGPKDLEKKQIVAVRRDTGEKLTIPLKNAVSEIKGLLKKIHENLYSKACKELSTHVAVFKDWSQFIPNLEGKNLNLVPFCGEEECEDRIKADSTRDDGATDTAAPSSGAKSLCIPLEQPTTILDTDKCIHPSCNRKPQFYTLFGRSY